MNEYPSIFKENPVYAIVLTGLFITLLLFFAYIYHLTKDKSFHSTQKHKTQYFLIKLVTKYIFVSILSLIFVLIVIESNEYEFNMESFQKAMSHKYIQAFHKVNAFFILLSVVKFVLKKAGANVNENYMFLLDSFTLFIMNGYLIKTSGLNDVSQLIIMVNAMIITIGMCNMWFTKGLKINTLFLAENILYLYIIISLIITK